MEYLTAGLAENMAAIEEKFRGDGTLKKRRLRSGGSRPREMCIYFCDGMVATINLALAVVAPLTAWEPETGTLEELQQRQVLAGEAHAEGNLQKLLHGLVYGDTVLLLEGSDKALLLGTKGFDRRAVQEPVGEQVVHGPKEGFCETMMTNLALLRRRVRTPALRLEFLELGTVTHTSCCLCYIEGVADRAVLAEVKKRLTGVQLDGIFSTSYLAECIRDRKWSPVRTTGSTERPDVLAAKLLEGRVGLLVDGSPTALTMPYLYIEHFQDCRDYYQTFVYSSVARVLRFLAYLLAIGAIPAFLALLYHHPHLLPDKLLYTIISARAGVPMPAWAEMVVLVLFFDLLQEAGLSTPAAASQPLSIVGALVLGQAAVEARFVSAPMVILVAVGGIAALLMTRMRAAVLVFRAILMGLSLAFGLWGVGLGLMAVQFYMVSVRSFGVPVMYGTLYHPGTGHEDTVTRPPFFKMKKRGRFLARNGGDKH